MIRVVNFVGLFGMSVLLGTIPGKAADMPVLMDNCLHRDAEAAVAAGDEDAAFLDYHSILQYGSASGLYATALFACGEYYVLNGVTTDAESTLTKLVMRNPDTEAALFAMAYLYQMTNGGDGGLPQTLKKRIVEFTRLRLMFTDFKEYSYESPLGHDYLARYFIDRVEFYRDGVLFEKITF